MVWPNLGAEEGSAWPQRTALPRVATTLRLWRHLLGESQEVNAAFSALAENLPTIQQMFHQPINNQ